MKKNSRILAVVLAITLAFGASLAIADDKPAPDVPVLSETDKLTAENLALKADNALMQRDIHYLRAQISQVDAGEKRAAYRAFIKSLEKEGFRLDLEKEIYVPLPKEEPAPED